MADDKIRVILIDDHRQVHEAVSTALGMAADIELVAHGRDGYEAIALCDEYKPDVILMDVVMPNMDGVQATRIIHIAHPQVKILVLSGFQDDETVRLMVDQGAAGYVLKDSLASTLANTIRVTHQGQAVFSQEIIQNLRNAHQLPSPNQDFDLTARELEVLKLIAEGLSNKEIAQKLVISPSTVKFHLTNTLYKMHVDTRAEALTLAAKRGLI